MIETTNGNEAPQQSPVMPLQLELLPATEDLAETYRLIEGSSNRLGDANVFVDESSGTELPSEDTETPDYYVITGVTIERSKCERARELAQDIVMKHAGQGKLKSSQIGSNAKRRKEVLQDIAGADLPFYCLVVNKRQIKRDSGLRWHRSFYKFLHRIFYTSVRRAFLTLSIVADRHGDSDFMGSFCDYFTRHAGLMDSWRFSSPEEEPLIVIADIIAGSVRRAFLNQDPPEVIEALGYPSIPIEEWPPFSTSVGEERPPEGSDKIVLSLALKAARGFVEGNINSEISEKRMQAEVVRYLLMRLVQNPTQYVYRNEITEYLRDKLGISISGQVLSTSVIAAARDGGVIISSTNEGMKIPHDTGDMKRWIDRANSQIVPYLKRVEQARNDLLTTSGSEYDIVSPESYPDLSGYLRNR